jgi:hypothetical protein
VKVTVRNDTKTDISSYAAVIDAQMQGLLGNTTFDRGLEYFQNNSLDALVIIENEAGHTCDDVGHYRVENDGITMALPFEWLANTAVDNDIRSAMRYGFNSMRGEGQANHGYARANIIDSVIRLANGKNANIKDFAKQAAAQIVWTPQAIMQKNPGVTQRCHSPNSRSVVNNRSLIG